MPLMTPQEDPKQMLRVLLEDLYTVDPTTQGGATQEVLPRPRTQLC